MKFLQTTIRSDEQGGDCDLPAEGVRKRIEKPGVKEIISWEYDAEIK